jgi:hypothetical protein
MGRTAKEIKDSLPGINSEHVEVLSDELDRILALKTLFRSEGGKVLIDGLRSTCAVTLRKLIIKAKDNPDLPSLLGLISVYSANAELLAQVQDISMEKEIRMQLDEAVKEAYVE